MSFSVYKTIVIFLMANHTLNGNNNRNSSNRLSTINMSTHDQTSEDSYNYELKKLMGGERQYASAQVCTLN